MSRSKHILFLETVYTRRFSRRVVSHLLFIFYILRARKNFRLTLFFIIFFFYDLIF